MDATQHAGSSAKKEGWHSRRHESSAAHDTARTCWQARSDTKKRSALERARCAQNMSPAERLKRLDARLGLNQGAVKERARLEALEVLVTGGTAQAA